MFNFGGAASKEASNAGDAGGEGGDGAGAGGSSEGSVRSSARKSRKSRKTLSVKMNRRRKAGAGDDPDEDKIQSGDVIDVTNKIEASLPDFLKYRLPARNYDEAQFLLKTQGRKSLNLRYNQHQDDLERGGASTEDSR